MDDYTADELVTAFVADEVFRYSRMQHEHGPDYAVLSLPDQEDTAADIDADIVDAATYELANTLDMDPGELFDAVLNLTAGDRDPQARAYAVAQLAGVDLDADEDDEDDEDEDQPPPKRRKRKRQLRARQGQQLASQGSAENAAGYAGAGEGGAGPSGVAATRKLVRMPTGELQTVALTEPLSPVDRIVARHPELFVSLANTDGKYVNPAAVGPFEPGTAPNVRKAFDFEVHDVGARDDGDPTDPDGGRTARIIARLQADHPNEFGRQSKTALKSVANHPR
jgi:hypothetical protein